MEELKKLGSSEAFLNLYDYEEYQKALERDHIKKATEKGLKQGLKQGIKEGIEQGKQLGLEQGREEGIEQGKEQQTKEIAISLYKNGDSKEKICNILKITPEKLDEYVSTI